MLKSGSAADTPESVGGKSANAPSLVGVKCSGQRGDDIVVVFHFT